jgi:hypothetical protein
MPHLTLDEVKYVIEVAGGVGSFIVFCIAVSTYYRTERWKRAGFLAHEMKDFFATVGVQSAMLLIDWGERRIRLLENVPEDQAIYTGRPGHAGPWIATPHHGHRRRVGHGEHDRDRWRGQRPFHSA